MTTTEAIHPLHVVEDLWDGVLNPSLGVDDEDRAYRGERLTVLLETLKRDPHTIINELERLQEKAAQAAAFRQQWKELQRQNACCEDAQRVRCVCSESWSCPTHGTRCFGSHD